MAVEWINKGSPTCNAEVIIEDDPNSKTRHLVTCSGCRLRYTATKL